MSFWLHALVSRKQLLYNYFSICTSWKMFHVYPNSLQLWPIPLRPSLVNLGWMWQAWKSNEWLGGPTSQHFSSFGLCATLCNALQCFAVSWTMFSSRIISVAGSPQMRNDGTFDFFNYLEALSSLFRLGLFQIIIQPFSHSSASWQGKNYIQRSLANVFLPKTEQTLWFLKTFLLSSNGKKNVRLQL